MIKKKITHGFVVQNFDSEGNFISQEFIAGDVVEFENEFGEPLEEDENLYHSFDME